MSTRHGIFKFLLILLTANVSTYYTNIMRKHSITFTFNIIIIVIAKLGESQCLSASPATLTKKNTLRIK